MKEVGDSLNASYIVNCVLNASLTYTAIMLNILTIHAIRKTSSLPKPLKTLLLSLAVSDLGVGLLAQPLNIARMIKQLQKNTENNSFYFTSIAFETTTVIFGYSSFFTVVAISVDRFLAIHLHLRYQELVTHKRVVVVVISTWVLSIFLSSVGLWITDTNLPKLRMAITIILGLCFISTTIIYCIIYVTVRRHTDLIQALQIQQMAEGGEMANAVACKNCRQHILCLRRVSGVLPARLLHYSSAHGVRFKRISIHRSFVTIHTDSDVS